MRLFFKEHRLLIVVQSLQFILFSVLVMLSGFQDYAIILYSVFVNMVLLSCYLGYHYYSRRHVYQKLVSKPSDLVELLEKTDNVPIGEALDGLLKAHYQLYMERLCTAEDIQKNHLKFIDRWVHQMKTPLSVIELTAQDLDEPASSNIREETERLKKGLHTVLNMARLRTIEEDFHIRPVFLESLIHEVNQQNKRYYIRNQIYPHLAIQSEGVTVETDEKWLFFILDQLLQNAVKYSVGRNQRIDLKICKTAGAAVLEIKDYGIGIPAHDLNRIFQAFYTGDNGRIFRESTGMGLYLTKEVADYLGHTLDVISNVEQGTTIRIHFTKTQTIA